MNIDGQAQTVQRLNWTRARNRTTTLEVLAIQPPAWTVDALCAQTDPEAFYPEKGGSQAPILAAKRICAACPVTNECLTYALDHGERFGIWGGLSERERRRLRRPA